MAGIFSPFGLQYVNSLSTSENKGDGFRTYEFDPTYSGFSGDLATYLVGLVNGTADQSSGTWYAGSVQTQDSKYIYPMPIFLNLTDPVTSDTFAYGNLPTSIGVFDSFEYYPASLNGQLQKCGYYIADTPLMPGTKVLAKVVCDPNAIYNIQVKTAGEMTTGARQNDLFKGANVACDTWYARNLSFYLTNQTDTGTATVYFPLGSTQGFGGSLSYLSFGNPTLTEDPQAGQTYYTLATNQNIVTDENIRKQYNGNQSLIIVGLSQIEGNAWASSTTLAPNNYVQVKVNKAYPQTQKYAFEGTL